MLLTIFLTILLTAPPAAIGGYRYANYRIRRVLAEFAGELS